MGLVGEGATIFVKSSFVKAIRKTVAQEISASAKARGPSSTSLQHRTNNRFMSLSRANLPIDSFRTDTMNCRR